MKHLIRFPFAYALALLLAFSGLRSASAVDLQSLLYIDRLHYYLAIYAPTLVKKNPALATLLTSITPDEIAKMGFTAAELGDAKNYDALTIRILQKRPASFNPAEVAWAYNFFKGKLNLAYLLSSTPNVATAAIATEAGDLLDVIPEPDPRSITLDADTYISSRTSEGCTGI